MRKYARWASTLFVFVAALVVAIQANAGDVKDFYKGKRITLLVQYSPGGAFDVRARWLARYLPALTGAKTIVRNMPGGGGVTGYNRLYTLPPNGLNLLTAHTKLVAFDLFDRKGVQYDFRKFKYLGRVNRTNTALLVRKGIPTDIEGLRKMKQIRMGASSPFNEGLLAEMFDLPVTIVPGYGGSSERIAAMMRGELDATTATLSTALKMPQAVNVALTFRKDERTPDIPDLEELNGKQPWRRYTISFYEIFGAIITSPGVPDEKTAFLTNVLEKVTKDEKARKEAKKLKLPVAWTSPEALKESIAAFTDLSAEERKNLKFVIEQKYVGKLR